MGSVSQLLLDLWGDINKSLPYTMILFTCFALDFLLEPLDAFAAYKPTTIRNDILAASAKNANIRWLIFF